MRRFFYYCFFSQTWYFYHKTHIKWDVIISSSLRLLLKVWIWYRCQNRKLLSTWWKSIRFLQKITYQNTEQDVFVIFMMQETKNSNLFDKVYVQEDVNCYIQHEENWLRWIVIEQVNYYFPLVFPERCCNREKVIVMYSKKMKAKYMKEDVWKSFFGYLPGWHLATSLQINFFTENF